MTGLALACGVLLLAALVGAVVGRVRLWGSRLAPPTPSEHAPAGSVLLAAQTERGRYSELVPLLADWSIRRVLRVEREGPNLAASPGTSAAPGPVWRLTAAEGAPGVDPVEQGVLAAVFGHHPAVGDAVVVERDDVAWRDRVSLAIADAVTAQRRAFGTEPPRRAWLRPVLVGIAVVAGPGLVAAAGFATGDPALIAWLLVLVPVLVVLTALPALWPAASEAQRAYLQGARDLRAWVVAADRPRTELMGWAMIWNLPGSWRAAAPAEVAALLHMDRSFLRGDFARTIPEPFSLG
ncbi:hypothetical protein [Protaetiibacter mangrovi]|uniref:DUF2207 domain-containing protein n=1 Tax=Protaetiibacter mangrovi TaxID=2970926 RepID=A0ABT1ZI11_9MICO|nr:hypothetical protein [Protaetiibacter mangrovi]MCS0500354.1 hypothetical protein [Protaetiibacter mangrovi]TPX02659.1 hypothetical protein FJ656_21225 [Schumannella luteola]